jgi:type II secretory pathway component GspD/PulD (secretin)
MALQSSSRVVWTGALALSLVLTFALTSHAAESDDPAVLLNKGVELFKQYKYAEANQTLREARKADNASKRLSDDQRKQLSSYLDESAKARRQQGEAKDFIELGYRLLESPALGDAELAQAQEFFQSAMERRAYLAPADAEMASVGLAKVTELGKQAKADGAVITNEPTTAAVAETKDAGDAAKVDQAVAEAATAAVKAEAKAEVAADAAPKAKPAAKAKKKQAKGDTQTVRRLDKAGKKSTEPTLLDSMLEAQRIQKQQAVANYAALSAKVRAAVQQREFLAARDNLSQARQEIHRSRRLFSQGEYNEMALDVDGLANLIDEEERAFQQQQASAQVKEAAKKQADREDRAQQERFAQILELYGQARQSFKERQYGQTIELCQQIMVIEPTSVRAKDLMEMAQDADSYRTQHSVKEENLQNSRSLFTEGDAARIPITEEVQYPEDWAKVTQQRRELLRRLNKTIVGEAPARLTERKLQATIVPDMSVFRGTLRKATDYFKQQGIQMFVEWSALEIEGISPDNDVEFTPLEGLKDIPLRSALEKLLRTLGKEPNYAIDTDGIVMVSTRDELLANNLTPRLGRLETRVYNISDIMDYQVSLSSIPEVEPQQEEESVKQEDLEAKEFEDLVNMEDLVEDLTDMIVMLVRPESWRDAGGEGTVTVWRSRWLVVYQSAEVHDEIDALLEGLRETQTVQIAMESRFVTVSSNFLENIGVDLDVILNQTGAGYDLTGAENTWGNSVPNGFGTALVQQRPYTQLGALPASPTAGVIAPPAGWTQPYGHPGLVPTGSSNFMDANTMTPVPFMNGTRSLVTPENTGLPGNLSGSAGPAFQTMGAFLDDIQVNFLLEATQIDRYSSICQAPKIVMQNGTLGYIAVQTDVPYVEEVEVQLGESSGGTEPQIETMGFGVVLAVRPTTRDLRYVNMYVVPQVTQRAPDADLIYENTVVSEGAVSVLSYMYPGKRTTRVETTVSVPDGGTLLLGGLKQTGEVEREAGVPVLSKTPVLKRFFTNRSLVKDNFTLLVLIKPKIMVREEVEPDYFKSLE